MPLRYGSIISARRYPTQCGQVLCVILNYAHLKCVVEYKNIKQHLLGHICTEPMECFFKTLQHSKAQNLSTLYMAPTVSPQQSATAPAKQKPVFLSHYACALELYEAILMVTIAGVLASSL